jgi:serine/threonine protein kinase
MIACLAQPLCLDDETLAVLVSGASASGTRVRALAHVDECVQCRRALAEAVLAGRHRAEPSWEHHEGDEALDDTRPSRYGSAAVPFRIGRYFVMDLVGRGGEGVVYAAHDPVLDRPVAIKVLHADGGPARPTLANRLLREAQAMARLSHPHVTSVYDFGSLEGRLFLVMEFVVGRSMREWLDEEAPSTNQILAAFMKAGRGLAAAHEAGLVHRDFKPGNVLMGDDGTLKITDFGLAHSRTRAEEARRGALREATDDLSVTRTGVIIGTPAYMAPEQLAGRHADARSDVFSFCATLYEALYGVRPFRGSRVSELRRSIMNGELSAPSPRADWVAPALRKAVVRGLEADPNDRYVSMEETLGALRPARRHG